MVKRPKLSDYKESIHYLLSHLNSIHGKGAVLAVNHRAKKFGQCIYITSTTFGEPRWLKFSAEIKNGVLTVRALRHTISAFI